MSTPDFPTASEQMLGDSQALCRDLREQCADYRELVMGIKIQIVDLQKELSSLARQLDIQKDITADLTRAKGDPVATALLRCAAEDAMAVLTAGEVGFGLKAYGLLHSALERSNEMTGRGK